MLLYVLEELAALAVIALFVVFLGVLAGLYTGVLV